MVNPFHYLNSSSLGFQHPISHFLSISHHKSVSSFPRPFFPLLHLCNPILQNFKKMPDVEEKWLDEKEKEALQYIEDITTKADEIQRQILNEILSTNANVEYLQQHGLVVPTDSPTFKKLIPLVCYEQLRPYIARIADGDDSSILCSNPITEFFKR